MLRMRPTPRKLVKSFFVIAVIGFVVTNLNLLLNSVDESNGTAIMERKNEISMAMGVTWAKLNTSRSGNGSSVNGSYAGAPLSAKGSNKEPLPAQGKAPAPAPSDLPHNPSGPNASFIQEFIQNINAAQKVRQTALLFK